jgi:RHS repeat-associated protein
MDAAIGSAAKTLTYGYDAAGNRTSIKWPDGFEATYVYDAVNRPQTVTFGGHTATITHDSRGRRTRLVRSNGVTTQWVFRPDSDLQSLTHTWAASSGQAAGGWAYVHDAAGRLTSIDATRLDLEWLPTTAYAKAYGPANNQNQVASQAGQALSFNANGNLAIFQGATYAWTFGNRLAGVSRPGMSATYAYDGEDRRTMKTVDGVITRTLWSGADEVAEMDGAGNILRRFIPDGSGAMDGRLASVAANGTVSWLHTDHQGSVVATSNAAGAPVSLANYSPNGELGTALDGTALTAPPIGSPFGYTGRQYDPETGLWQYRARYYHPQLGQFLSHDPIGTKDDPNLYLYVANDPVNRNDPTGMYDCLASKSQCNKIDKAITNIRDAASAYEAGSVEERWLTRLADSFGTRNDGNGLRIRAGEAGDFSATSPGNFKGDKNGRGGVLSIDFTKIGRDADGSRLAPILAHEGQHAVDHRTGNGADGTRNQTMFMEGRAYRATYLVARVMNSYGVNMNTPQAQIERHIMQGQFDSTASYCRQQGTGVLRC